MVREELERFFANKVDRNIDEDQIGGVLLALEVTGLERSTIYSRVSNRTIPHRKQGKKLYFSRMKLKAWIEAGRRKTRTEISLAAENFQ
jgi:predicted DNA-binding transcriptional regulator AlpA